MYENGRRTNMSRADYEAVMDYEAGMEHTLNPQPITVNCKTGLTEALSEGDPKA
jgi:hypothetical protein